MIRKEQRAEAFALMRLSNNLAVVLGPPIGGFLVSRSYSLAFFGAAAGMIVYGVLMILLGHETLLDRNEMSPQECESIFGYMKVLHDRHFLSMVASLTLTYLCAGIMWTLLGVYTIMEHNLSEEDYSWIPMTNALMVVFLQVLVTAFTKRHPPLLMMALGSFFFAIGVGPVAVGEKFWAFWTSMVVMSIGELIVVPTADTYVSRLAPLDMRGRYMSIAGLAWSIGNGIGPLIGGYISKALDSQAIWYGAFTLGIGGTMGFMLMEARKRISGGTGELQWKED